MAKKYSKKLAKNTRSSMIIALAVFGAILLFGFFKSSGQDIKYLDAINLWANWFLNNENDEFIGYEYHIDRNYYTKEDNDIKKLWALRAIAKASNFLENDELKTFANKWLAYYEYFIDYDDMNDFYYVNLGWNNKNIWASAYVILTLLEMEHQKKDEYIEKLANWIIYQQEESGKFKEYFYGGKMWNQNYYPGLASYALMRAYEYNGNEDYLKAVEKSFKYYSLMFESNPSMGFVSQYSMAYSELYKLNKDEKVADFVKEMSDYILKEHKPREVCGKFQFQKGITTASYLEGVISAYQVAKESRDRNKARCYNNYINEAEKYLLTLQVDNTKKYKLPAIGGFLASSSSKTVKVGSEHHAIMALINAYELGILK